MANDPRFEQVQEEMRRRAAGRTSLEGFIRYVAPWYEWNWHHRLMCEVLDRWAFGDIQRLMLFTPPRHGKALALGTPVPTPSGWATMGSLRVGDTVFGSDGRPVKVVGKSEVHRNKPVWEVTTDTGHTVVADGDHLWQVRLDRKWKAVTVRTTEFLANRTSPRNPMVRVAGALELPERLLKIDPYVLGAWLGDGNSADATITQGGEDSAWMRGELLRLGYPTRDRSKPNSFGVSWLHVALREMGLLHNKHIPKQYMRASAAQRLSLLQGLIDTDGHVAPDGQVEFCSTVRCLADGVVELVASLGCKASMITGRAMLYGRDCGAKFRVMFYMKGAARMPRKAALCRDGVKSANHYISFKPAGTADTVCITVDAADHLFLVGRGMIPTHNSQTVAKFLPAYVFGRVPDAHIMVCCYAAALASEANTDIQATIDSDAYKRLFPGTQLSSSHNRTVSGRHLRNSDEFDIVGRRGKFRSSGVGGGITGKGFDYGVIDDPTKSRAEADSFAHRQSVDAWYQSTFRTRRQTGAAKEVFVLTRWHEDDLSGRIIKRMRENPLADQWTVLELPALRMEDDCEYDPRRPGTALWPKRHSTASMLSTKATIDEYEWWSVYQQRPTPRGGSIFHEHWFNPIAVIRRMGERFFECRKPGDEGGERFAFKRCTWFQTIDTALTESAKSDYTVVMTCALMPNGHLVVWHVFRARLVVPNQFPAILKLLRGVPPRPYLSFRGNFRDWEDCPVVPWPVNLTLQAVETATSGIGLIQQGAQRGLPLRGIDADGSKTRRAGPVSVMAKNGMVWYNPEGKGDWLEDFVAELVSFPGASHDDIFDCLAYSGQLAMHDDIIRAGVRPLDTYVDETRPNRKDSYTIDVPDHDVLLPN